MFEAGTVGSMGALWELVAFFGAAVLVLFVVMLIESHRDQDGK
jgi:hypothetical protein